MSIHISIRSNFPKYLNDPLYAQSYAGTKAAAYFRVGWVAQYLKSLICLHMTALQYLVMNTSESWNIAMYNVCRWKVYYGFSIQSTI